jgi:hypothetical protein
VLARAFARFVLVFCALVTAAFLVLPDLSSMTLYLQTGLLRGPPETPPCSVQLNFVQNGAATGLRARNHSLNALESVEIGA